jgi:hypothetical protein
MQVNERALLMLLASLFLSTHSFATDSIQASANLIVTIDQATSIGRATYTPEPSNPGTMTGYHTILPGGTAYNFFGPTSGVYEDEIEQFSMDGECYHARIQAAGTRGFNTGTIDSPSKCVPCTICVGATGNGTVSQNPVGTVTSSDCSYHTCGTNIGLWARPASGWTFVGWSGDVSSSSTSITVNLSSSKFVDAVFQQVTTQCDPGACGSPILVNLNNSSYDLTGVDDTVRFDLDTDGTAESTTWSAGDKPIAFLARDLNRDGVVSNGHELFGNFTILRDGTRSSHGFAALSDLDDNNDGLISAVDAVWADLILWVDTNHNGFSEVSEMSRIGLSEIVSISTSSHTVNRKDSNGNEFRQQGQMNMANGSRRLIYDVWLLQP